MRFKFTGPPNPGPDGDHGHDVVVRGRFVGTVMPGEVIDVPDELCVDVKDDDGNVTDPAPLWSPELWEPVTKTAAKVEKGDG